MLSLLYESSIKHVHSYIYPSMTTLDVSNYHKDAMKKFIIRQ
jgi:hypothetical protein